MTNGEKIEFRCLEEMKEAKARRDGVGELSGD
jgi:hypothetical protein